MSISMETSVTLYDTSIANAMENDAEFAAGVFNALGEEPNEEWQEEVLEHLDDAGRLLICKLAGLIDRAGAA